MVLSLLRRGALLFGTSAALVGAAVSPVPVHSEAPAVRGIEESAADAVTLLNWSATHAVHTNALFVPESVDQVEQLVADRHAKSEKLRPLGSALSPNALAFEAGGMVSLALLDKILWIDEKKAQVRVQSGARIAQVTNELRKRGLVLQNFASISEQQVGGFFQVGAHGTGIRIPPVDEQVVSFRIATPAVGSIEISSGHPLFGLLRVGLGAFGVVTEVTLQATAAHKLVEYTKVMTHEELRDRHEELLSQHQHVRYMWIPYTDSVVVVYSDPLERASAPNSADMQHLTNDYKLAPLRELLLASAGNRLSPQEVQRMSFAEMRDYLIARDPLNTEWIRRVNQAEAAFWKRSEGIRIDWSDRILGFDCGGHQWVSEVAFHAPLGQRRDLEYMTKLLRLIQDHQIPAPAPIEQRWTSGSGSLMSPVYRGPDTLPPDQDVYSWVGIIMYLPTDDEAARQSITREFWRYRHLCAKLWEAYDAAEHWAKIEIPSPSYMGSEDALRYKNFILKRVREKYPLDNFGRAHRMLDPNRIMTNAFIDEVLLDNVEPSKESNVSQDRVI
jgi:L-galactono-1,4-lactone dehydrogenase